MPEATLHVLYPPEPDAAFLFFSIALWKIDSGEFEIGTPIRTFDACFEEASRGAADLIAPAVHACAHLFDRYEIFSSGATSASGPGIVASSGRADFQREGGQEQMRTSLFRKRVAPDGTGRFAPPFGRPSGEDAGAVFRLIAGPQCESPRLSNLRFSTDVSSLHETG